MQTMQTHKRSPSLRRVTEPFTAPVGVPVCDCWVQTDNTTEPHYLPAQIHTQLSFVSGLGRALLDCVVEKQLPLTHSQIEILFRILSCKNCLFSKKLNPVSTPQHLSSSSQSISWLLGVLRPCNI